MRWIELVSRDPVPWLLDPENPSSRYLTLRHVFHKNAEELKDEQAGILNWEPIKTLRSHWDPVNHWGRARMPYFGGPVGSFGSLHMLQQIGTPPFPEAQTTCEALMTTGMTDEGVFTPERNAAAPWLCYTGIALDILTHFGYGDDPCVLLARNSIVNSVLHKPENLICSMVGGECRDGLVKALSALLHIPESERSADEEAAIDSICIKLIGFEYDFTGEDKEWSQPRYPRYYESDLLELCHVLAYTKYRKDARLIRLLQPLLSLQNAEGKWCKVRATPSLAIERIQQPSRWLTYEAVHTLTTVYGDDIYGAR
jgi:hypothetical protein